MELRKFTADVRAEHGKGASARLRKTGKIPAVAYGKNLPAQALAITPSDLSSVLTSAHGRNSVIELDVTGQTKLTVLIRDFQYHPLTRQLLHADFVQIALDQPVDVAVPLETTGKAKGVVDGGMLRQVFRRIPVRCLPEKIPAKLVHDVTALGVNEHVLAKDLSVPEGVTIRLPDEQTVLAVAFEKQVVEEEEAKPADAAAAAAGATGAAAPAAGAAPAGEKAEGEGEKKKADKK
ncbi:MAG TPA: 50S ribosomal protein L25 [Polyangiaceae bacterium]